MKTFKQFICEIDPLEQTAVEMWLRYNLDVDQEYAESALDWLTNSEEPIISLNVWDKMLNLAKKHRKFPDGGMTGTQQNDMTRSALLGAMKKDGLEI